MTDMQSLPQQRRGTATFCLLFGATVWGVIWYPYRQLEAAGIGGALATLCTYAVALAVATILQPRAWLELRRHPLPLLGIALAAGWSIVSYVVAILQTEVMRVLLLFYLAPLWSVPLARIFLNERPPLAGYLVLLVALAGAAVMLWQPRLGVPLPASTGEWLGLSAGVAFACSNVFVRKAYSIGIWPKSIAVWLGTIALGALAVTVQPELPSDVMAALRVGWPTIVGIGVFVLLMSLSIQYGLTYLPSSQAMVILLFELIVAAITAYWLAGEQMRMQDWIGGAMIILAGLFSDRLKPQPSQDTTRA